MTLPFGAPIPPAAALCLPPSRGVVVHLAAIVRGRLEGIVEDRDDARAVRRIQRAAWAMAVAGVAPKNEPISADDAIYLLDEDEPPPAPWLVWGPGQDVPEECRSRDLLRALGVARSRANPVWGLPVEEVCPAGARDAGRDIVWLIAHCLGIRSILGPIGLDEVERMRVRSAQAWRRARSGGG